MPVVPASPTLSLVLLLAAPSPSTDAARRATQEDAGAQTPDPPDTPIDVSPGKATGEPKPPSDPDPGEPDDEPATPPGPGPATVPTPVDVPATSPTLPAGAVPTTPNPALPAAVLRWQWLNNPLGPSRAAQQGRKLSPHRLLPLPSLRSQPGVGLMLGASVNYAYRPKDDEPNRIYLFLEARVSLKKVHNYGFFVRLRNTLGRQEIFEVGPTVILDPVLPYYGVANHANLRGQDLTSRYYQVEVQTFGGIFNFQYPLYRWQPRDSDRPPAVLRSYSGLTYHVDRIRPYEDSRFAEERAYDAGLTRRGVVRLGFVWDRRDNESNPRRGALHDVTVDSAGPFTGSSQGWGRFSATLRHYWTLGTPSLVLAHRLTFDSLWGDPPFMPLGDFGGLIPVDAVGGMTAGRGWMRRRYVGKHKAYASVELRFDPIEFKLRSKTVGIGMKGYVDLGMVAQTISQLPSHLLVSGGPGVLLIWDRFAVIRLEGGFSRETAGFYLMTEHAF